jgi:hypothetical protein
MIAPARTPPMPARALGNDTFSRLIRMHDSVLPSETEIIINESQPMSIAARAEKSAAASQPSCHTQA